MGLSCPSSACGGSLDSTNLTTVVCSEMAGAHIIALAFFSAAVCWDLWNRHKTRISRDTSTGSLYVLNCGVQWHGLHSEIFAIFKCVNPHSSALLPSYYKSLRQHIDFFLTSRSLKIPQSVSFQAVEDDKHVQCISVIHWSLWIWHWLKCRSLQ